jgi:hypothetical protein
LGDYFFLKVGTRQDYILSKDLSVDLMMYRIVGMATMGVFSQRMK